jgi:WhiB family redox-sensing transcriptional regulator
MNYPDFSQALCKEVGIEFFFTDEENERDVSMYALGKTICSGCPVKKECLEWAVKHEAHGLWGGLTPRERYKIRAKRNIILQQILVSDYVNTK